MLRFGSGTYNVRDSEVVRDGGRQLGRTITCSVSFLDNSDQEFELDRHARGQDLLDKVFDHLELIEKDYFGLQFIDAPIEQPDNKKWLEPSKSIRKQMEFPPFVLKFRVKFYVSDPSKLQEEYTRYHFYLQLRKDILEGRMQCPESSLALLGSYSAQSELGDFSAEEHGERYLENFRFAPDQTPSLMNKVKELHILHRGQTPADAEYNFLDHAKRLEMYGVDLHQARDSNQTPIQLGVTNYGVAVFQNAQRVNVFSWAKILKLSFKRKQFFLQLKSDEETEMIVGFNLGGTRACKVLWKSCIEHHTFFRLIAPPLLPSKSLFSLGSRYRFSGRTEYQTLEEMKRRARIERTFHRSGSKTSYCRSTIGPSSYGSARNLPSPLSTIPDPHSPLPSPLFNPPRPANHSTNHTFLRNYSHAVPGLSRVPNGEARRRKEKEDLCASCPTPVLSNHPPPPSESGHLMANGHGGQVRSQKETTFGTNVNSKILGVLEDENLTEHSFELPSPATQHNSFQSKPKRQSNGSIHPGPQRATIAGMRGESLPSSHAPGQSPRVLSNGKGASPLPSHLHSPLGNGRVRHSPVVSTGQRSSLSSLQAQNGVNGSSSPVVVSKSPVKRSPVGTNGTDGGKGWEFAPSGGSDEGLVLIRLRPDSQGRFGFNVKGGADQNHPIIVSRVVPGSPADTCYPRLNEGDQVLLINGLEVREQSHDQVVRLIRAAREAPVRELALTVRPNVYVGEDIEEPEFQYVPETPHVAETIPRSDLLSQSLLLLNDSLAAGAALIQFDYRDVLPYDATLVKLQNSSQGGDYINANFVNMEIPSSGIVNRYIAAQGPLPHTTADFWQVVWEQLCSTVIMLTATVERGRIKCHQYWPRLYETQDFGTLQLTCLKEKETQSTAFREFSILNKETKEERLVSQMQYMAWPDHGVPEEAREFISFVGEVRAARVGSVEPVLVHCSAGIGRTGVLILMETAMCLIEANEPVYPLDIVRSMRDQRPMLIQTSSQYKFVCEAILKCYNERVVKPLAEYQHR